MKQRDKEPEGLGAIVVQALETMASRDASRSIVDTALEAAGLRKLPQDPVVLLAFLSGALYRTTAARLGEEWADALIADAQPILERAAEHALAIEEDVESPDPSPPAAPAASHEEPFTPQDDARAGRRELDRSDADAAAAGLGGGAFEALELEIDGLAAGPGGLGPAKAGADAAELELEGAGAQAEDPELGDVGAEAVELELGDARAGAAELELEDEGAPAAELELEDEGAPAAELELEDVGAGAVELELEGEGAEAVELELGDARASAAELELEGEGAPAENLAHEPVGSDAAGLAPVRGELDADAAPNSMDPPGAFQLDFTPRRAFASLGAPRPAKPRGSARRTTDPMGSGVKKTRPPPRMSSRSKAAVRRYSTAPGVVSSGSAPDAALPGQGGGGGGPEDPQKANVHRVQRDPRRPTLGYEAVVDDPGDGLSGRPCAVVAVADQTLRAVVARILRREGFGVVTAPDSAIGRLLSLRFSAALVVVDSLVAVDPTSLPQGAPPWVILDPEVGPDPVASDGCVRVGAKPIDPAALVGAVDQIMPPGWRR